VAFRSCWTDTPPEREKRFRGRAHAHYHGEEAISEGGLYGSPRFRRQLFFGGYPVSVRSYNSCDENMSRPSDPMAILISVRTFLSHALQKKIALRPIRTGKARSAFFRVPSE